VLHQVHETDLETAARLLTRAMSKYPLFTYVVPEDSSRSNGSNPNRAREKLREDKLRHVLRFILGVAAFQGEIVAPSQDIEAIAVWIRSDKMRLSPTAALRVGFLTLPFKIGLPTMTRLLGLAKRKQMHRRKILVRPYYRLDMLGVDPQLQNRGYGRLLIEAKLEEIDRERADCYLETSDNRNIGYYQRYGFELIHQHCVETVPVYCLLRSGHETPPFKHDGSSRAGGAVRT
jgi:ribosomal protein S18 acetylase RimI-like enzyme